MSEQSERRTVSLLITDSMDQFRIDFPDGHLRDWEGLGLLEKARVLIQTEIAAKMELQLSQKTEETNDK